MTLTAHRPLAVLVLAASAAGAASSCSTPGAGADGSRPSGYAASQTSAQGERSTALTSIAQIDHGRRAQFAVCTPPGCPVITPKTLAVDSPAAAAPSADTVAASDPAPVTSLGPGESFVFSTAASRTAAPTGRPATGPAAAIEPLVNEVVVTFAFASATLTAAARAAIDIAAAAQGIRRIDIRGRTDNVGPAAANRALARQRAQGVVQYLRARHPHLATAALSVDARGGCCYAAENGSARGRARNRRVEIAFGRDRADL
jgi:outer membrane protein OmpA-like peptidoglycan-associated protein